MCEEIYLQKCPDFRILEDSNFQKVYSPATKYLS
jgi:hypothetical protein